jgi:hypothetical protein
LSCRVARCRYCLLQGEIFDFLYGPFRDVALERDELPYGTGAKTLLQPVDQPSKLLRLGRRRGNGKMVLVLSHLLGAQDMEGRCLKAKVCLEVGVEAIETQADELSDMPSVPARCRQSQI